MDDNKILKWIMETNLKRWLLFLPLSIVSALLGNIIWELINRISWEGGVIPWGGIERILLNRISWGGVIISTDSFLYNLYNEPLSGLITGFIFVYVGGYIAPHRDTKIFLVSIVIIMSLVSLIGNIFVFKSSDYWICLYSIFLTVGAFIGRNYLNDGEK